MYLEKNFIKNYKVKDISITTTSTTKQIQPFYRAEHGGQDDTIHC